MGTRTAESRMYFQMRASISNLLDSGRRATIKAISLLFDEVLEGGIDASQANRAMAIVGQQIAPGATFDVNVYNWSNVDMGHGYGYDLLGQPAIFEEIVALALLHAGGTGQLEVYASVPYEDLPWVPRLTEAKGNALRAGGVLYQYQPDADAFDVVDGLADTLRLGAVDNYVTFDLYVLGRHDDDASSSSDSSTPSS